MNKVIINSEHKIVDLEIIYKTRYRKPRAFYVLNGAHYEVDIPKGCKNPKVTAKAILLSERESITKGHDGNYYPCVFKKYDIKINVQDLK